MWGVKPEKTWILHISVSQRASINPTAPFTQASATDVMILGVIVKYHYNVSNLSLKGDNSHNSAVLNLDLVQMIV